MVFVFYPMGDEKGGSRDFLFHVTINQNSKRLWIIQK
jgi:hypothetical protein